MIFLFIINKDKTQSRKPQGIRDQSALGIMDESAILGFPLDSRSPGQKNLWGK
jgi:hypothetical protein